MIIEVSMENTGSTFKFDTKNLAKPVKSVSEFITAYELNNTATPIAVITSKVKGKEIAINKAQISDIVGHAEDVDMSKDTPRHLPPTLATEPTTSIK